MTRAERYDRVSTEKARLLRKWTLKCPWINDLIAPLRTEKFSALHYASFHQDLDLCKLFVELGCDTNLKDDNGKSKQKSYQMFGICSLFLRSNTSQYSLSKVKFPFYSYHIIQESKYTS